MTPLEAARALMGDETFQPEGPRARCLWCSALAYGDEHDADCPWLAMPRIVKALEAIGNIVGLRKAFCDGHINALKIEDALTDYDDDGDIIICYGCNVDLFRHAYPPQPHADDCAWLALLAALGEGDT